MIIACTSQGHKWVRIKECNKALGGFLFQIMSRKSLDFLEDCLVVVGSTLAYYFPADYIKQTVKILSKRNRVIVFLWGNALSLKEIFIRRFFEKKSFYVFQRDGKIILFTPVHILPFRRFASIQYLNLILNVFFLRTYILYQGLGKNKKVLWIFNYELYRLPAIMGRSFLSLYDCVDYFSSLDKKNHQKIKLEEKKLIDSVDYFFVNSLTFKNLYRRSSPVVVPQGFDLHTFRRSVKKASSAAIRLPDDQPVIGYAGSINYRLDYQLLISLAQMSPHLNFVFVGQRQKNRIEDNYTKTDYWLKRLLRLQNVFKVSNQPKEMLPQIISQFTVCLIPYNMDLDFNKFCHPMKLFEYFYMGKPVVSTPIVEVTRFKPLVMIARNTQGFQEAINKVLTNGWSRKYAREQKKLAISNSWSTKVDTINQTLSSLPGQS